VIRRLPAFALGGGAAVGDDRPVQRSAYRSPAFLARAVTAAYVPLIACGLYAIARFVSAMVNGPGDAGYLMSVRSLDGTLLALQVVGGVAFFAWLHRAESNLPALGAEPGSPTMAVAYFFIPILNLWMPFSVVSKLWLTSDPAPGADRPKAAGAAGAQTPHFVLAWWIVTVISHGTLRVSRHVFDATYHGWGGAHATVIGLVAIKLVAVALTLAVVWSITRRQEGRAAGLSGLASARVVR
jgi:hypothetical protein